MKKDSTSNYLYESEFLWNSYLFFSIVQLSLPALPVPRSGTRAIAGTDGMRTPSRCPLGGTRARAVFFRSKQSSPVRFSTGCGVEQNYTARSEKNESQNFYPLSPCVWPHPPRHQRKLQQSAPRARVLDRSQRAFGSRAASQSSVLQYSGVNSGAPAWVSVSRMKH